MSLTAIGFMGAIGIALLMALTRHPVYGLYAYVGTFYLYPVDRWWGRDLPSLRWSLIAAAVTLLAVWLMERDAKPRPSWMSHGAAKILIASTLWIWAQTLWALSVDQQLVLAILYTKYLALFYFMHRLLDSEEAISGFLLANVLGGLYLGWLVLDARDSGRLDGIGGPGIDEANALGMHLSCLLLFSAALLVRKGWTFRLLVLISIPLMVNAILQTESRGAFLGLASGGLALLFLSPKGYRKYWYLFAVIGVVVLVRLSPANYWERMSTILNPIENEAEVDQSTNTRLELFRAQWEMFKDYPLGAGHRGTAVLSPRYLDPVHLTQRRGTNAPPARSSHNSFMTALTEQGLPGALLFLAMVVWAARRCLEIRRAQAPADLPYLQLYSAATGGALMVVLVAGMFTDYVKVEIQFWGIILLATLAERARETAAQTATVDGRHPERRPARVADVAPADRKDVGVTP